MTEREHRFSDRELEEALRDAGARLAYPATVDLVPRIRRRLVPRRGESYWATLWSPRLAVIPAAATVILLVLATLVFQPAGAQVLEGLRGLVIFRTAETPAPTVRPPGPTATPTPTGGGALIGTRVVASVEDASREVGFTVLVPAALGAPDEVRIAVTTQAAQAFLVYAPRPDLPTSAQTGIGLLVTEAKGSFDLTLIGKLVGPGTRVDQLTVKGAPAVWIAGLHQFFYRGPSGAFINDTVRLSGNVLVWNKGDLLVRIEADIPRDRVVEIATSMP